MALTTLDPRTALIVVEAVIAKAHLLLDAFRGLGLPVVLVNVAGGAPGRTEQVRLVRAFPPGWTDFVAGLDRQPSDHVVTKRTWGAFTGTDLESHLKRLGVTQVVIAGVARSVGRIFPKLGETGTAAEIVALLRAPPS